MTANLKAIYERGVLRLKEPLSLPDGTQVDVTVTSHEEVNGEPSQLMDGYPTNEQERAWINAHRDEYLGQWVALDGDHLVAHGSDARSVYDEARSRGVSVPYLAHVTPKVEAYVGGW